MSHARAEFNAELASVGDARRFVRRALIDLGAQDLDFEACQLVSELATNAVIHAATPFEIDLDYDGRELHIRVSDSSTKNPVTKSHSDHATTGRGLRLVGAIAHQWGVDPRPGGKTVWCTVGPDPARHGARSFASVPADLEGRQPGRSRGARSVDRLTGGSRAGSVV